MFHRNCPYFMSLGMTYDQYWYGDVRMTRAFVEADKRRQERLNEEAWLQGAYFLRALDATVGNAFRQKGTPPATYPDKPIPLGVDKSEEEREKQEEKDMLFAKIYMREMERAGRNWGKPQH